MKTGRAVRRNEELVLLLHSFLLPALQSVPQQHLGKMMRLENCVCFTEDIPQELDISTLLPSALKYSRIQVSVQSSGSAFL